MTRDKLQQLRELLDEAAYEARHMYTHKAPFDKTDHWFQIYSIFRDAENEVEILLRAAQ